MRKMRKAVSSLIPLVLLVSSLSAISVLTAPSAGALSNSDCAQTYSGITLSAVASGNDCILTISAGSGTWTVPSGVSSIAVVVVGGGGGGGGDGGSGGGGGELRYNASQSVTGGASASIAIGSGGAGGSWLSGGTNGKDGTATTITGAMTYTANSGKGGGAWTTTTGGAGGSAGSGGSGSNGAAGGGGPGDCAGSPSTATIISNVYFGAVGSNGPSTTVINPSGTNYGGGGGGGNGANINNAVVSPVENGRGRSGGAGGGGRGSNYRLDVGNSVTTIDGASAGEAGASNTGGGGGGGSACNAYGNMASGIDGYKQRTAGGAGGSGVVVIRYTVNVPGAPTGVTATAGYTQASLSWTAPTSNGGAAISGYTVTSSPSVTAPAGCVNTGSTSCTFTGLTAGTAYTFTVVATNARGNSSSSSASSSVTPFGDCSPATTTSGGYTYVAFKSVSTCNWSVPASITSINYLVVAGGGGGGTRHAGGGGAGGLLQGSTSVTSVNSLTITVGDGGAGGDTAISGQNYAYGSPGNNSSLSKYSGSGSFTTQTAFGGGQGNTGGGLAGGNGGSGGGALGSGGSPTSGQGFAGGAGYTNSTSYWGSGGGGGAGAVGATASLNQAGNGGSGTTWSNSGFTTAIASSLSLTNTSDAYFAGGGGGGATAGTAGLGGAGGGGNGNAGVNTDAAAGISNTGGGGGGGGLGSSVPKGGKGGSGVIILRYLNAPSISLSTSTINSTVGSAVTSYTISNSGGEAASYSISPAFSLAGLSWSSSNGLISGTPTEIKSAVTYTITATNATGTSTATFTLSSSYTTCSASNASPGAAGYTTLVFTNNSLCNWTVPVGITSVDVLVVGGGGAGGARAGGGGGAGGYIAGTRTVTSGSTLTISVGAGGTGQGRTVHATNGGNSSLLGIPAGDLTAIGGGGAGGATSTGISRRGNDGGSGGGSAPAENGSANTASAGTAGQGNAGGNAIASTTFTNWPAAGGGGAAGAGSAPADNSNGGAGGNGVANSITGANVCYATGGGGGINVGFTGAAAGSCTGFASSPNGGSGSSGAVTVNAPTANTGSGGGGTGYNGATDVAGGSGADGVVVIRYVNGSAAAAAITTQPSGAVRGSAFTTQPVVRIVDGNGVTISSSTVNVVAAIASGTGTLSGTTTVAAVNGVATFTNLVITGTGNYTLAFTPTSLAAATSSSFAVTDTPIAAIALTSKVTAPVRAATASTTAVDDTQFTGAVAWYESNGTTAAPSTFAANTVYVAKVTLTAKTGYTLTGLSGSFTYAGATSVSYSSGIVTITFVATDLTPRSISFGTTTYSKAYLETQSVNASASVGTGSITYSVGSSTACTISGSTVTISSGTGTCSVTATVASDGTYASATTTSPVTITVSKAVSTIGLSVGTYTYTGSGLGPDSATTSGSTGAVSYAYAGRGSTTYASSSTKPTAVGTYTVTATLAADTNYASVSTTAQNFDITKASQSSLTVTSTTGNFGTSLTLTSSGGTTSGSVTYATSTAGCTITSGVLTTTGAVTCVVTATMAGNDTYNSVSSSATNVVIEKGNQAALDFTCSTNCGTNTTTTSGFPGEYSTQWSGYVAYRKFTITAFGSGTGAYSYSIANGTTTGCLIGTTLASTTTSFTANNPDSFPYIKADGVGTCQITFTRAADSNYNAASVSTTITFSKTGQSITFSSKPTGITWGDTPLTLAATSTAGTTVTYRVGSTSICSLSGNTFTILKAGSCYYYASADGNSNYNAVTDTYNSFTISTKAITLKADDVTIEYGSTVTKSFSVTSGALIGNDAISSLTYRYSGVSPTVYSSSTSVPTGVGTYLVTISGITLSTGLASNYTVTYDTGTLTINTLTGLTPTFGTSTSTADGFTVQISNYSSSYQWAGTATASGSVAISNTGLVTVTGVVGATSSTATITTTRTNYATGSATVSATSLALYTISYAGGSGATGTAPSSPSSVYSNATFTTPTNTFSRTGYTFAGWSDGTNTYAAAATYPTSGTVSGNVTLTATWTANSLAVTYNSKGGSDVTSGSVNTGATISSAPTAPTKSGYTLSGWSATDGGTVVTFPFAHGQTSSFTLYAVWAANALTVTYDSQGGSIVSNGSVNTGASISSAPSAPTKAGYTLTGWSATSTGSVVTFPYAHNQTANFTLYAIWTANTLTVTFDSQSGSVVSSGSVATDAKLTAPTAPTRTGYTFSGWSTTSTGSVVSFTGGYTHGQTANFTLYAIWTADGNVVAFNNNSGSGTMSNQSITSGTATALTTNSFTRTGYTFSGWNTVANGSGTAYTNGQSVTITAGMTLYAQWTGTTNTITYDSKGGSAVSNGSFVTGGSISAAPTAPTRAGYTLSGWSETDGGSVVTYPFSPTATSGITLYAAWSAISCSPTSSTAGGYTIYTFTTAGTCFWTVPNGLTDVEVLAVAGGGGGGYAWDNAGAGGGAGGQIKTGTATLSTTLEVTVGAGGSAGTTSARQGGSGGNSVVGTITALGGGGGCAARATTCANSAQATGLAAANGGAGGAGGASGKGGGGSSTTASATSTTTGGNGTSNSYSGSAATYGAGGAGGTARAATTNIAGTNGSSNTGNGGSGASAKSSSGDVNGGAGGTGLVIVRVANALTVSFDTQGGSSVSDTSTVTAGILSEPTAPTRSTYTFLGWFTATTGGSAITFPYTHGQTANFTLYARWSLNTYAIAFNANNGSGTMANQTVTHGVAAGLNANLFTRANYVFYRWATAVDGTGTTYSNLAQVTLTAGTTLYAQWTANTYVVTYNYDNATGGASTTTSSFTTGGSVIVLPTPTKTGYSFAGWFSDAGLTSSIGSAGANYSPTGTTLSLNAYAKWTAIDYTFTYDLNNADSGSVPTETSKQIGQTATIKANTGSLVRAGYTFAGWNTQSNGSGTNYLSGALFTVQSSNVTLYAKWTANSYTITYNSNGGTGSAQRSTTNVSTDTYTTGGSSIALPGVGTLERTGYTFGGWNTSAAGTGTNRLEAATFTTVSDVIFYAKWNPVTYSITYDGNTSTGGTTPTTGGYTTGQASPYSVVSNTFTKTLHVFGGWNTAADGSGTNYSAASSITTLSNITLYAIWIPQYTLHYAINGGTVTSGSLPSDTLYNANTAVSPIFASVSRIGYTFGGWKNGSSTIAGGGSFTIVQDSVLTAIWTPVDYTISYDSDGGTTPPNAFTKQIGQSFEVGSAVIKPGYNFTGWKAGSSTVGAGATVVTGSSNISYTAQWTAKVYRVSYDWNGGRGTAVSDVDYTFGTTAITLPLVGDRVKDGYNFAGWAESTNGSALGLTYIPSQTRTLYALWTLGNFTVTYDAGRGTVANSSVAVQNGSATTLPMPTRANFVFNGWHTASTGGSRLGANGDSFTPSASQTVYARWIQSSLYGITDSLSRIGSVVIADNISNTFSGANSNSSVAVSVPANSLPAGTTISFDLVGNSSRATGVLTNVTYLVSIAISWLTGDETVPNTASDKPISVTITNASIKAGAAAYAIINNVSTLLGTATQDGSITVSITSDPEVVIAATKPGAPTSVSATSNGAQQSVISWSAPSSNGGAAITGYTVTTNTGATCTTSGTSCTISSLTNGTAYTFTVTATNSVGTGLASSSASATTAALYTVTFDAKGGSSVTAGSFLTASTVSEPTAPTRDGYSFSGWSATDGGSVEVFPYAPGVTTNITMYAKWDALDHAVTFDAKSGSSVTAAVFASGGTVAEPTAPTRSGYTFAGWSATDGGTRITFPYAPGVVTDITLYAKWTAVSSGGGSSSGGGGSSSSSNSEGSGAPVKSNVTVVAPVTVIGDSAAKVPTVEIFVPVAGTNTKPPAISIDAASEKFIADVKVVDGKLVLTPETGFSGKKIVTVTVTENGADRFIQIPLTVLPEAVSKPVITPTNSAKSVIKWAESPNADAYTVYVDGKKVCSTSATSCSVGKILGPDSVVEIVSNGGDRTVSDKVEADFKQSAPIIVTRVVSATITKAALSKVDTKALDKVIALIKGQGFTNIVISDITTTKKTEALAAARIAAIKKYIDEKTGSREITFQVVPAASRTYFNNISVKG